MKIIKRRNIRKSHIRNHFIYKKENIKQETTLSVFIKDNIHLLEALGIFLAIILFSQQLLVKNVAYFLSYVLVGLVLLILTELISNFINIQKEKKFRLILFIAFLFIITTFTILYWLLSFREIWNQDFLMVWFFLISIWIFSPLFIFFRKKLSSFRSKALKKLLISLIIGAILAHYLYPFLDKLQEYFLKIS